MENCSVRLMKHNSDKEQNQSRKENVICSHLLLLQLKHFIQQPQESSHANQRSTQSHVHEAKWREMTNCRPLWGKLWSLGKRTHSYWHHVSVTGHKVSKGCLEAKRWFHSPANWPRINLTTKQINQSCVDQWHFPQRTGSFLCTLHGELPGSCLADWFNIYTLNEPVLWVRFAKIKLDCVDSYKLIPSTLPFPLLSN